MVRISVPGTLIKVTPVIMFIIQSDSNADLPFFSNDSSDRTFPSGFGGSLSVSTTSLSRLLSYDSANAGCCGHGRHGRESCFVSRYER